MSDDRPKERSSRASRRNLKRALGELDRVSERLEIPGDTVGTATRVYREMLQASSEDRMYGWSIEETAVACLYVACKVDRVPRNAEEFIEVSDLSKKLLLRRSKTIRSDLDLDIAGFADPSQYVERYCEELELDNQVVDRVHQVLEYVDDAGISGGKSPQGQAAAAIYNAVREFGIRVTQRDLTEVADVSEVTIRNRYQEQAEVVKEREQPPDDPMEILDWFGDLTNTSAEILGLAESILEMASANGHSINDESLSWSMAAVRLAGEEHDDPVGLRTIKIITDLSNREIRDKRRDLVNYRRRLRYQEDN